jgi:DNA-binding MarR family transcriptional regulator
MTQIITQNQPVASQSRATQAEERRPVAPASLVDTMRDAARRLVAVGQPETLDVAISLVEGHYRHIAGGCPVTEDLRPWQLLASDLAAALKPLDPARAERALDLADEIRATVTMIARNPAETLALRPASRRVLVALAALGGRAELTAVRAKSGHNATHLSNILKPLRAHGLVEIETATDDRRARTLALTHDGRAAIADQVDSQRAASPSYRTYIEVRPATASDEHYQLGSKAVLDPAH